MLSPLSVCPRYAPPDPLLFSPIALILMWVPSAFPILRHRPLVAGHRWPCRATRLGCDHCFFCRWAGLEAKLGFAPVLLDLPWRSQRRALNIGFLNVQHACCCFQPCVENPGLGVLFVFSKRGSESPFSAGPVLLFLFWVRSSLGLSFPDVRTPIRLCVWHARHGAVRRRGSNSSNIMEFKGI